ncbi:MAG: hypothetical protein OEV60_08090 [Actinomycetota bacterium]|nr:hypothetical protein [Actinomycetota bacterium]MDH5312692.1 hypothetical protein [Actinomycetota bacterium]
MDPLGVGVPVLTGPAEGWNFWPFLGIPIALLIAFRFLHLPRRVWVVVVVVLVGLASADAISAWGVVPAVGVAACLVAVVALIARLRRSDPPIV